MYFKVLSHHRIEVLKKSTKLSEDSQSPDLLESSTSRIQSNFKNVSVATLCKRRTILNSSNDGIWVRIPREIWMYVRVFLRCVGYIQKFPDWVDNETKTTINTRWEATQRVAAVKLTRLTNEIAIQLHLVAESCTICSSRSRRPVRKLLDTPS
jgi:hypothetical protein